MGNNKNEMNNKEVLALENLLVETIKSNKESDNGNNDLSKLNGVTEGARIGLNTLRQLKGNIPLVTALMPLNSQIHQSIYALLVAEDKFMKREDSTLRNAISYHDNLITTLQLLRTKLSELINEDTRV